MNDFIEVFTNGKSMTISVSSIALVQDVGNGSLIVMKEKNEDGSAITIRTSDYLEVINIKIGLREGK